MADNTRIEWTDATWNVITGCDVLSPGCTNCYAMRLAGTRLKHHPTRKGLTTMTKTGPVWNREVRFNGELLDRPLRWRKPRRIFVCAHGDLFYERVPDAWIDKVFAIMALCSQHTFQVLTKRAGRMREYLTDAGVGMRHLAAAAALGLAPPGWRERDQDPNTASAHLSLPNVHLGFSAEDQTRFDERWVHVKDLARAGWLTWLSAEPLLGPIDAHEALFGFSAGTPGQCRCGHVHGFTRCPNYGGVEKSCHRCDCTDFRKAAGNGLGWVVSGDESDQNKPGRRVHPDCHRSLRDQCQGARVPFFLKQRVIDGRMVKEPELDGRQWLQFPEVKP